MTTNVPEGWGKIEIDSTPTEEIYEPPQYSAEVQKASLDLFPAPSFDANGEHFFPIMIMGKPMKHVYSEGEYQRDLLGVQYDLSRADLAEGELPEFVACVRELNNLFDDDEWKDAHGISTTIKIAKNLKQAKEFVGLLRYWKEQQNNKAAIEGMQPIKGRDIEKVFIELSGEFKSPERPCPPGDICRQIIDTYINFYQVAQSTTPEYTSKATSSFKWGVEGCCFDNQDMAAANELIWLFGETIKDEGALALPLEQFADAASRYARHLSLDRETATHFKDHLLPAVTQMDENVRIIFKPSNSWAMRKGEFSIGEYTCHLYSGEANPQLINELMLINSEIPTAFAHQFEQNRRDGVSLLQVGNIGTLKEAIHDQRPKNHDVIQAMVDFYDKKISTDELLAICATHDYVNREGFYEEVINPEMYERMIEERTSEGEREVQTIHVLRRLAKNTTPIPEVPPSTPYEELNNAITELGNIADDTEISPEALSHALHEANSVLESMYTNKQVGVDSRLIIALGFINRATAIKLRSMKFEEQVRAYRADWFAETVKFHDLTANPENYDPAQTNEFIRLMQQEHTQGAYNMLGKKVAVDLNRLGRNYKSRGFGRWSEMLWSGNMSHELLGMLDLREPNTPESASYKQKFLANEEERLRGD